MLLKFLFCLILLTYGVFISANEDVPVVDTVQGQVSGVKELSSASKDYLAYYGIPFAEPPVGDLRFKASIPKEPWDGIKDGSKEGQRCLQLAQFNEPEVLGSEDCLWLNVYTPEVTSTNLKPVLVWIYGGRWLVGTSSSKLYSPAYMMDFGDIVVVSIQYRLGPFGFLSTADAEAPGNYGLQDQVLALKWIQQNIQKFGGDPGRVIVSGHSAGSASAHMHLISPLSKGLLHGAISLSGTAANYWANRATNHAEIAARTAEVFNCPTSNSKDLIECLRDVDAEALAESQWQTHDFFHKNPAKLPLSAFLPRIDSEAENPFMPEAGLEFLRRGEVSDLPWMVGLTSMEGAWYTSSLYGQDSMEYLKEFDRTPIDCLRQLVAGFVKDEGELRDVYDFYFKDNKVADQSQRVPMSELTGDMIFSAETLLAIHLQTLTNKNPVFFYQFNFRGEWSFAHEFEQTKHDYEGVAHLDEIRYFMRLPFKANLNKDEVEIKNRFTNYIANFVRTGKPTTNSDDWPAYKANKGQSMVIDTPDKSGMSRRVPFETKARPGRMLFWLDMVNHSEAKDVIADYEQGPTSSVKDEF